MPLARLTAVACACAIACPAFLAGCASEGSSGEEGQGGAGQPSSEVTTQSTGPDKDRPPARSPAK